MLSCSFDTAPVRGTARDDVRPGLRVTGFERRVSNAFHVTETQVVILRLFCGAQNGSEVLTAADA